MIIRRLEVRNFRKLAGPVALEGLGPGLTVVVGDNEEGKSTLLQALRSVFFDRHNLGGAVAKGFLPYGSEVRPEISVEFDLGGGHYLLRKAFCQRPEAVLQMPTGVATGPAAEEKLQELLRFSQPGRGASGEEHQGVWGLFWVEQGKASAPLAQNDRSRLTLRATLEGEVGDVLGGRRGQQLLARIGEEYQRFFTAGGRPRGDYAEAGKRAAALEAELNGVEMELRQHDEKVDRLQRGMEALARHRTDCTLEKANTEVQAAEQAQRQIEQLEQTLKKSDQAATVAQAKFDLALANFKQREQLVATVTRARASKETLAGQLRGKSSAVGLLAQQAATQAAAAKLAHDLVEQSDQGLKSADRALRLARLHQELEGLRTHLDRAREAGEDRDGALANARAIAVDDKDLKHLKKLEGDKAVAEQQLTGVATNVDIEPEQGQTVRIGDQDLAPPYRLRLTEVTRLDFPGCARITVSPGGDLEELRAQAQGTDAKLRRALGDLGFAGTAAAETRLAHKKQLLTQADQHQALLLAHAPKGLEELQNQVTTREMQAAELRERGAVAFASIEKAAETFRQAEEEKSAADRAAADTSRKLEEATSELNTARQELAKVEGESRKAEEQLEAFEQELSKARDEETDGRLREARGETRDRLDEAKAASDAVRLKLERAEPGTVALRLEKARAALKHIEHDIDRLRQSIHDLQIELRALGQRGLGEDKERLEGELALARAYQAGITREAKAIELLYKVLTEAERSAKETFLSPVTKRVQPYLRILLPEAELKLNEDMEIVGLQRGSLLEPFEALSLGTREQLAILTRLAFADLLREKGQPAAVILDDAIAYADPQRFDRMQLILHRAAKNMQIIVLTCRERDYQSLGAPIVRLDQCRVRTAAEAV
jgi:DNA repair exonuclease SbcCD ATPase subunit